ASAFPAETPARVVMDQGKGPEEMIVRHPLGDVLRPLSADQIWEKFKGLSRENVHPRWQDEILSAIGNLEAAGLGPLLAALSRRGRRYAEDDAAILLS
ncbi:MmgE/PrpD family protein, partial [Mesorhizobium sp. M00.F.Ca.ET.220.01.1.1]